MYAHEKFSIRELLGNALLKEVLTDDWRIRLDPEIAHILLSTATLPGKSYRKHGDGDLNWRQLSGAFDNRHIDAIRVRGYAKKMLTRTADGSWEWKDRITDIGVSPQGVLAMGFHTCIAVIASDTTHEVRLLSNFTASEQDSEGTGRKQDFGDVLYRRGVPSANSAAAMIRIITDHRRNLSPLNSISPGSVRSTMTELLAIADSGEMQMINEAVAYGRAAGTKFTSPIGKYRRRSAIAPAVLAHLYLEWMQQYPLQAPGFFSGLLTGEGITGPVLLLRERFSHIAVTGGTPLDAQLSAHIRTATLAGLAWKAYLSGGEVAKLQLSNPPAPLWCEAHRP